MAKGDEPVYRAYVMGPDNHIRSAHMFATTSDYQPSKLARRLADGQAIEVWDGGVFDVGSYRT